MIFLVILMSAATLGVTAYACRRGPVALPVAARRRAPRDMR